MRRPSEQKPKAEPARRPRGRPKKNAVVPVQQKFEFVEDADGRRWDFFALVTNDTELDPVALTQLYRDRGNCENNFDEYKNQWGWGGFVTRKLKPTRATARLTAIVALGRISATASLLGFNRTWALILKVAFRKWMGGRPLEPLADGLQMLLPMAE